MNFSDRLLGFALLPLVLMSESHLCCNRTGTVAARPLLCVSSPPPVIMIRLRVTAKDGQPVQS